MELRMHVLALKTVKLFWQRHPDSELAIRAWYVEVRGAKWAKATDVKARYPSASVLSSERLVFNIGGNKYRLIVRVNYASGTVFVRFIGTHAEYDKIGAKTV
jgi:mRNA interferase HigB